jgi:hypothetical protein
MRPPAVLLVLALLSAGCGALAPSCAVAPAADNAAIARAFAEHRSEIQVTAQGTVDRLLSDEMSVVGQHQRFILRLMGARQTLLITNNISIGRRVPVALGDDLVVHGEYIWNDEGGLIHFTHHDPDRSHEGGWIQHRGVRYD